MVSYGCFQHDHRMNVDSFTLQAFIFPTTPEKGIRIITKWSEKNNTGFGMFMTKRVVYLVGLEEKR